MPDDERERPEKKTDPMKFGMSDRLAVENRMDREIAKINLDRSSKMLELTKQMSRLRIHFWVALAVSLVSVAIQIARVISIKIHS